MRDLSNLKAWDGPRGSLCDCGTQMRRDAPGYDISFQHQGPYSVLETRDGIMVRADLEPGPDNDAVLLPSSAMGVSRGYW